ncbi:hypothetical protein V3C99_002451 [Haemonchus contortus]
MTPAAPFEALLPKAKFRNLQHRAFGSASATVNGIKKASRMKIENKGSLQSLCQGMESCEEVDDHSPRRGHFFHRLNSTDGTPSTSRCFGDSHIEVSDEDHDACSSRREHVKKAEAVGSKGRREIKIDEHYMKEECIDSILDDRYPFLDGNNHRNYYIIRSDGRLAEVFRTDLFDRLRKGIGANEESDDDDVPGNGLARMTDRWRAEWSNGIQIPLRAVNPNPAEVRKAVVKRMSSKLSRILRKRQEVIREFLANPYDPIRTTPLRLYECTILDELWVKLYNEQQMRNGSTQLSMEVFLQVMNSFEVECYKNIHRKLLEPLHSPSSRLEDGDEEAACDICLAVDSEPDDEMVFCDGCNLCVHMSCYGLQELPPDEWLCMKCRLCFGRNPPCVLCPTIGGALKCTDTNQWAHVVCALWIPECRFGDFEKREPVTRLHEIKEERWTAKCSICDTRQGACIKCSVDSCLSSFHATCALRSGLEMRIEQDPVDDRIHMISLCPKHRSAKPFKKDLDEACEPSQAASDDETTGHNGFSPLAKLEQSCYEFVDPAATAAELKVDLVQVQEVFAYWVKKRLHLNKGRPLIENLQDEIKVVEPEPPQLELPAYNESNVSPPVQVKRKRGRPRKNPVEQGATVSITENKADDLEKLHAKQRLEHSLVQGRHLLDLVVRRSKEQRNYLNAHMGALLLITEHLSKPLPLSHRKDKYLNDTLQSICLKEVIDEGERRADEICGLSELVTSRYDQRQSSESTPVSTSSSESYHPPTLRHGSSAMQKIHVGNKPIPPSDSVPCRSRPNLKKNPKRSVNTRQPSDDSDDFEEQSRNRRKSLRSSDKPVENGIGEVLSRTRDIEAGPINENRIESSSHTQTTHHKNEKVVIVDPNAASMASTADEQGDTSISHDTSVEIKHPSSKGSRRQSRLRHRSDSKAAANSPKSPSPKRQRSTQAIDTKLRLLKSLNLKNANKDFKNRSTLLHSSHTPFHRKPFIHGTSYKQKHEQPVPRFLLHSRS